MKKEILVVISVALVIVIVGCGLWLGWYAVDSHHQIEAFAGLSQEFVLEQQETGEQPSGTAPTEETSIVTLAVDDSNTPPRHDLAALQAENFRLRGLAHHPRHGHRLPHHAHIR